MLDPSAVLSKTLKSTVSRICPGTNSSGPFDVNSVTNPSPSTTISSDKIPLADVYAKSPPCNNVS